MERFKSSSNSLIFYKDQSVIPVLTLNFYLRLNKRLTSYFVAVYWYFGYKMKYAVKYNIETTMRFAKPLKSFHDKFWHKARRFNNDSANSIQGSIVDLHSLEDAFLIDIFKNLFDHLSSGGVIICLRPLGFPNFQQNLLSMEEKVIIFPSTLYYVNCTILKG